MDLFSHNHDEVQFENIFLTSIKLCGAGIFIYDYEWMCKIGILETRKPCRKKRQKADGNGDAQANITKMALRLK